MVMNGDVLAASCGALICYNGATCLHNVVGYYCDCPSGYTGTECLTCE